MKTPDPEPIPSLREVGRSIEDAGQRFRWVGVSCTQVARALERGDLAVAGDELEAALQRMKDGLDRLLEVQAAVGRIRAQG